MKKSESIIEFAKALSKFQGKVKQPHKDKANPFFKNKYVPLENVVEAITDSSSEFGLSFMQFQVNKDEVVTLIKNGQEESSYVQKVGVYTLVMHDSGEWIESDPIFATPTKQDAQGVGAVTTYLKRYSLSAAFGITSDEDDDGHSASRPDLNGQQSQNNKQAQQPYQPRQPQQPSQQQPGNNLITETQIKALKAKLTNISKAKGADAQVIYNGALTQLNMPPTETKALTKGDASKVINYLATLEAN